MLKTTMTMEVTTATTMVTTEIMNIMIWTLAMTTLVNITEKQEITEVGF